MIKSTFSEFKSNYPMLGASYATWSGYLTDQYNVALPVNWTNVALYEDSTVMWSAKDVSGKSHSLKGSIESKGQVQLKLSNINGVYTFTGSVCGPNKIRGNWMLEGKDIAYGQFEIQILNSKIFTIFRIAGGVPQSDTYNLCFDPVSNKYVSGFGIDQVGYYLITGKMKSNGKVKLQISYKDKFIMTIKGRREPKTNIYKGVWSISGGGSGEFTMNEAFSNSVIPGTNPTGHIIYTPFGPSMTTSLPNNHFGPSPYQPPLQVSVPFMDQINLDSHHTSHKEMAKKVDYM